MARLLSALMAIALLAAPAQALSPYTVFFEPGSARLTGYAHAILDDAALAMNLMAVREIEIIAGTDRTGSASSNLALSRRRANAIRDALLARSISSAVRIRMVAAGENMPLVEIEDGVPEARNRFGQIVFVRLCVDARGRWMCRTGADPSIDQSAQPGN